MRMMSGNLSYFSIIKTSLKAAQAEASPPTLQGNNQRDEIFFWFRWQMSSTQKTFHLDASQICFHFPYNLLNIQDSLFTQFPFTAIWSEREKLSFVSNTQSDKTKSEKSGKFEVSSEKCKALCTSSSCIYARHFHGISQLLTNLSSGKASECVSHGSFRILIASECGMK